MGVQLGQLENASKIRQKYTYWNLPKPGTYILCDPKSSQNTEFEGSNPKIDFKNAKNAQVT